MHYCHQCGNTLSDAARFCSACGARRQNVAATALPAATQPFQQGTQRPPKKLSKKAKIITASVTGVVILAAAVTGVVVSGHHDTPPTGTDSLNMSLGGAESRCQQAMGDQLGFTQPFTQFYLDEDQDYVVFWQDVSKAHGLPYPIVQYVAVYPSGKANCVFVSDGSMEFNQSSVNIPIG